MKSYTDILVQRKLDQLAKLANELDAEAKRRYGANGNLFFESGGAFHLMAGDESEGTAEYRQSFIRFSSKNHCSLGAGAW